MTIRFCLAPRGWGEAAGTWTVSGSGDQRVALVFELIKRDGARRLDGGRSLLRWRWGDAKVDYRILPGHTDLQPVWTIARSMDFVDLALISPGKPARAFSVRDALGRGLEWAGAATYVGSPEALWIGVDGRGRHFARIDLADAEKRSRPWP